MSVAGLSDANRGGFDDVDGSRPNWGRHFDSLFDKPIKACDDGFYDYWLEGPIDLLFPDF